MALNEPISEVTISGLGDLAMQDIAHAMNVLKIASGPGTETIEGTTMKISIKR